MTALLALVGISVATAAGQLELGVESTEQRPMRRDVGVRIGAGGPLNAWLEAGVVVGWSPGTTLAPWGSYSQHAQAWHSFEVSTPTSALHLHAHPELRFLPFGGSTDRFWFRSGAFVAAGASLVAYDYWTYHPTEGERGWAWRPTASLGLSTQARGDRHGVRFRAERLRYGARFPGAPGWSDHTEDLVVQQDVYIFSVDWLVSLRRRPKPPDSTPPDEDPPADL